MNDKTDSFKAMLQRIKNRNAVDLDKTTIMDTREILGDEVSKAEAESKYGKTISKSDFQDKVKRDRAARGKGMLDKAVERSKKVRWLPDTDDVGQKTTEIKRSILKKLGKGIGRKAAGLAIGGPLALASEMADASEIGRSPRDEIIESTEYTPEQKKALLRGFDMKQKLAEESGDVSQDPTVLKAKEIGDRLQEKAMEGMTEENATANAMERISPEDQAKILKDMRRHLRNK